MMQNTRKEKKRNEMENCLRGNSQHYSLSLANKRDLFPFFCVFPSPLAFTAFHFAVETYSRLFSLLPQHFSFSPFFYMYSAHRNQKQTVISVYFFTQKTQRSETRWGALFWLLLSWLVAFYMWFLPLGHPEICQSWHLMKGITIFLGMITWLSLGMGNRSILLWMRGQVGDWLFLG